MSDIKETVQIHAPRATVYNALTSAKELMRWFPTRVESDPRTGGKYKFEWAFNDKEHDGDQAGTYNAVTPNENLSYVWTVKPAGLPTTVAFSLSEANGETVVNLVHSGWPDNPEGAKMRDGHAGPWGFYMQNLKSYLEKGIDERATKFGQKTI